MNNYIKMNKNDDYNDDDYNDNECLICFENIDKKLSYVKCYNCNKMYHEYCITAWKYKQNFINTVCPHCSLDKLRLHGFYINYCCFSWKLKTTNLKERITKFD
jgi:hypothetical protein